MKHIMISLAGCVVAWWIYGPYGLLFMLGNMGIAFLARAATLAVHWRKDYQRWPWQRGLLTGRRGAP